MTSTHHGESPAHGTFEHRTHPKEPVYVFFPDEDRLGHFLAKRTFDCVAASIGLVVLSPLLIAVAIAIKVDSKGSVLFAQKRCGKGGREFKLFKFRTMCVDAESRQAQLRLNSDCDGPIFKLRKDPRITRVGEFLRRNSLDELPQLFNVVRGEMSLVGPRPLADAEMSDRPSWRESRLSVKPGLAGLWQLYGRDSMSFDTWVHYDTAYVESPPTFFGDLSILFQTVLAVLTGKSKGV